MFVKYILIKSNKYCQELQFFIINIYFNLFKKKKLATTDIFFERIYVNNLESNPWILLLQLPFPKSVISNLQE